MAFVIKNNSNNLRLLQKVFLFFVLIFFAQIISAQNNVDTLFYKKVTQAVERGNANDLAKLIHAKVDITLPGQSGIYSKNQSKFILDSFFKKNKPESFYIENESLLKNNSFFVGKLHTADSDYRVCFITKAVEDKIFIYQIRIEE